MQEVPSNQPGVRVFVVHSDERLAYERAQRTKAMERVRTTPRPGCRVFDDLWNFSIDGVLAFRRSNLGGTSKLASTGINTAKLRHA